MYKRFRLLVSEVGHGRGVQERRLEIGGGRRWLRQEASLHIKWWWKVCIVNLHVT